MNYFFGKHCPKHPLANGKRYRIGRGCVACSCRPRPGRKAKPGRYKRMSPEQRKKSIQCTMAWAKANPLEVKLTMATFQLRKKTKSELSASREELKDLWVKQKGRCALTGVPITFKQAHLDHIRPKSKGGKHTIGNLRWLHPMTNAAKGVHSDKAFWSWIEAIHKAKNNER